MFFVIVMLFFHNMESEPDILIHVPMLLPATDLAQYAVCSVNICDYRNWGDNFMLNDSWQDFPGVSECCMKPNKNCGY